MKNKKLVIILALLMLILFVSIQGFAESNVWDGVTMTQPKGNGTSSEDCYQIGTGAELAWLANLINTRSDTDTQIYVKLIDDIDLGNQPWTPIGKDSTNCFKGFFYGNGKKIMNLYIYSNTSSTYLGLFGYVTSANISNLLIESGSIKQKASSTNLGDCATGAIAGRAMRGVKIENCYNNADVESVTTHVGGIVGTGGAEIISCYNTGNITGTARVAGIIGSSTGNIENCYNAGNITGTTGGASWVAGIVGDYNTSSDKISKCYNIGNISNIAEGGNRVAGIVSYIQNGIVETCYNIGTISTNNGSLIGGIAGVVGTGKSTVLIIRDCYNIGLIDDVTNSGSIVGLFNKADNPNQFYVSSCYWLSGSAPRDYNKSGNSNVTGLETIIEKSEEEFASGEVAYLLDQGNTKSRTTNWGQGMKSPVFSSANNPPVYKVKLVYDTEERGEFYLGKMNLIVASYQNDKLIGLTFIDNATKDTYEFTDNDFTKGYDKVKIMLFESFESIRPLCSVIEVIK